MTGPEIPEDLIGKTFLKIQKDAEDNGYHLNPDIPFTRNLVRGLLVNQMRYGYQACPCRLATGTKENDLDIICPCDYRDPDLDEFGACYCALYVTEPIVKGVQTLTPIPERRPPRSEREKAATVGKAGGPAPVLTKLPYPVWRCKVCGYLCARDSPPQVCPVCKAGKERFERFL
ncbi:MAG: ferredoxin-thioredoxin reductase catalytic domain-containing protein [Methanoregulaceae archaeon]